MPLSGLSIWHGRPGNRLHKGDRPCTLRPWRKSSSFRQALPLPQKSLGKRAAIAATSFRTENHIIFKLGSQFSGGATQVLKRQKRPPLLPHQRPSAVRLNGCFRACSHMPHVAVNVKADEDNNGRNDKVVEGAGGGANLFPVLAELVAEVSEGHAENEGADESIDKELGEIHTGDAGRQTDEGAHYRQQAADKDGAAAPFGKETVGAFQVMVGDEDVFAPAVEEGTPAPHPHAVSHRGADGIAQRAVAAGDEHPGYRQGLGLDEDPARPMANDP